MNYEYHNLDGTGSKRTIVYPLPSLSKFDYWLSVTNINCPTNCGGKIIWHEAGYVSGYRICNKCKKHFLASGTKENPKLLRVGQRKG